MKKRIIVFGIVFVYILASSAQTAVELSTAVGLGADAGVSNDDNAGPASTSGSAGSIAIRHYATVRAKAMVVRFDLRSVVGDLSGATLTFNYTGNRSRAMNVYGLVNGDDDFWMEASLCYNNAPGLLAAELGTLSLDSSKLVLLGTMPFSGGTTTSTPAALNLDAFLAADTNGFVSFVLYTAGSDSSATYYVTTKEGDPELSPVLTLPHAEWKPDDPEAEQPSTLGQRQMEWLDRGTVAVRTGSSQVYVGWRLSGTEWGRDIGFHIYRGSTRITAAPITQATNYIDTTTANSTYSVSAVIDGIEQPASAPVTVWTTPYLEIPLRIPPGGTTPDGVAYTYSANDLSVGDLTGDGRYEIVVKWDPSNAKDNSQSGYTGNVYLDAYTLDGTFLWRIDLGRNIRAGAHYTQFIVYDLDGDGRAEIACKTADATIDGAGTVIGSAAADYRNSGGYIITGPEYLTVFDGLTGAALATTNFYPDRVSVSQWGDGYGNRVDRFLAGVAYVDGRRPSLIMARGYYGPQSSSYSVRNEIVACNWRQGRLSQVWTFKAGLRINNNINSNYIGQGCHSLAIADVTGNGKDDIIYGSAAIRHDGTGLYSTGLGHGDALHVSDMDPSRPGLEVFMPHESAASNGNYGATFRDAATGQILWYTTATSDIGRGVAFDVDPRYPGYEAWATNSNAIYSSQGELITATRPSVNFGIWWDGDLLRELLDGTVIDKWNYMSSNTSRLLTAYNFGAAQNNGTKANPGLVADILGDWREEAIWRHSDNTKLLIFTTTIPTEHRLYTLMHDPVYRMSVAWQNTAYNQPTHPGFFLGAGMAPPPTPKIRYAGDTANGVLWEWWRGINGTAVGDLTSDARYPDASEGYEYLPRFETPQNWDETYGSRVRGYLVPQTTGSYTFWIAGDDTGQLRLSPDARAENAQGIAQVPAWTDYRAWDTVAEQRSASIPLTAGRKYYIETLHKEGTGGDHLSVAWQGPGLERQVIDGYYLRPWQGTPAGQIGPFAEAWLMADCGLPLELDLNGDCTIDYIDFGIIAQNWLNFEN